MRYKYVVFYSSSVVVSANIPIRVKKHVCVWCPSPKEGHRSVLTDAATVVAKVAPERIIRKRAKIPSTTQEKRKSERMNAESSETGRTAGDAKEVRAAASTVLPVLPLQKS